MILLTTCLVLPSDGLTGYDIKATVDSTTWEIHRSTQAITFNWNGTSTGNGSFSKAEYIKRSDGINSAESSYALSGTLDYREQLLLRAREGAVTVKTDFEDYEIDSPNQTQINLSRGNIEITEQWPTYLANYRSIKYIGSGITTREIYENNGDMISTASSSKKLRKENIYRTYVNKTVIYVNLTPPTIEENRYQNKSSTYQLALQAADGTTDLNLARLRYFTLDEPFGRPRTDNEISEHYIGNQNMNLKVRMNDYIISESPDDDWLGCCTGGYSDMNAIDRRPLSADGIFGCSCSNYAMPKNAAADTA